MGPNVSERDTAATTLAQAEALGMVSKVNPENRPSGDVH
jgi:hypothetical protein